MVYGVHNILYTVSIFMPLTNPRTYFTGKREKACKWFVEVAKALSSCTFHSERRSNLNSDAVLLPRCNMYTFSDHCHLLAHYWRFVNDLRVTSYLKDRDLITRLGIGLMAKWCEREEVVVGMEWIDVRVQWDRAVYWVGGTLFLRGEKKHNEKAALGTLNTQLTGTDKK